jgi:hypothetical protein
MEFTSVKVVAQLAGDASLPSMAILEDSHSRAISRAIGLLIAFKGNDCIR